MDRHGSNRRLERRFAILGLLATLLAAPDAAALRLYDRRTGGAQDLGDGRYLFLFMLPKGADPKLTLVVGPGVLYRGTITDLRRRLGG